MDLPSLRFERRAPFRGAALLGAMLLSTLTDGFSPPISAVASAAAVAGVGHTVRIHGRRLRMGSAPLAPTDRDDAMGEGGEGDERARLLRWIESRHRAAPGVDWHAIEAANREAALARLEEKAAGAQPVWHERGPVGTTGSTNATAIRPDGRTLLVGSSLGGVFSGTPGGRVWAPLIDSLGPGYLQGLAVSSQPETWAAAVQGTGAGVYVSRNRGAAWAPAHGLAGIYGVDELLQDGGDPRTLYLVGAVARPDGAARVLARSRDGGLTFSVVQSWDSAERPGIWTGRTGAGPLYLLSHGQLYVSTDRGSSFSPRGQAIASQPRFSVLRGSEAGAPTLYAAAGADFSASDLFVSEDGGRSWEKRFSFDTSTFYGSAMAASIQHPGLIILGGVDAWRSTDGGRHFKVINEWYDYIAKPASKLHADIRGLEFFLYHGRETLFLDTDGGSYQSTDGGATVANLTLNGLRNAQFYGTWSSATNPDLFLAGSQDQGLQQTIAPRGGPAGAPLATVVRITGDYANLTSASHDLANVFALYPGSLLLFAPGGNTSSILFVPLPAMTFRGFFAASAADPDDPSTVYVGGDHIWRMTYLGGEDFAQTELAQNFALEGDDYITALAIAPSDHRVWYAATAAGRIWLSRDRGASWSAADLGSEGEGFRFFATLRVSATDPHTCFAGGSGYGAPPVLVTHDGGASWSPLAKGLPQTMVSALGFDGAGRLYAATDAGPYVFNAATAAWRSLLGGGAPVIPYTSVEGIPAAHLVRFGTYGRGVWDYVAPGR
jgi:photosystem II stability/assembly factor-like uncharacterized protein